VKKKYILLVACVLISAGSVSAYKILYAEQYYKLFHLHLNQYPDDCLESIYYLEQALRSPFANPLNALAKIDDEEDWERYRNLFYLHVNLKLVEQWRLLASKYDKRVAYFYNAPFKEQNLESLDQAEELYNQALTYWEEALRYYEILSSIPYRNLPEVQNWEDEYERIQSGELDYAEFIGIDLSRLKRVRERFLSMDTVY
jgi:hypothetical protein